MARTPAMLVLLGIVVIVAGFVLRFNPLLVVVASALVTGLAAHIGPLAVLAALGKAFNANRFVTIIYIVLPVIGLLEAHGLQAQARALIERVHGATVGRLLIGYLLFRQATAALGLTSIAGPAQTVRPLVAPMAEAAADAQAAGAADTERVVDSEEVVSSERGVNSEEVRALVAATDNVGLFFGEDIFVAIGSILLMKGVLQASGIDLPPFALSIWAIPTAIAAFLIHAARLVLLDRRLSRRA